MEKAGTCLLRFLMMSLRTALNCITWEGICSGECRGCYRITAAFQVEERKKISLAWKNHLSIPTQQLLKRLLEISVNDTHAHIFVVTLEEALFLFVGSNHL